MFIKYFSLYSVYVQCENFALTLTFYYLRRLERIVLRNDEGLGPWNNHYYNSKDLPKEHKAFQSGHSLELQSLITAAALRNAVHGSNGGVVDVSGVSYSGDGAEIAKVREKTISFTFSGKRDSWLQLVTMTFFTVHADTLSPYHLIKTVMPQHLNTVTHTHRGAYHTSHLSSFASYKNRNTLTL